MILDLIKQGKIDDVVKELPKKDGVGDYAKEYNENARDLRETQVGKRKDKQLDGEVVRVAKIPIPFQRKIVTSAASFLFGSPVNISSSDDIQPVLDLWDSCRMDTLLLRFAEKVKSETEAAIVFYPTKGKDDKIKIKARVLSSENGSLHPVFDAYGDMIAFGWRYKEKRDGKEVEVLHLFTEEKNYVFKKTDKWEEDTEMSEVNLINKIPVVYLSQKEPEWWMVKDLIDRYEMNLSKFADTNDYFSSPMYKAKGAVKALPKKDSTGKIIKLDIIETEKGNVIPADVDVISWDRAPEALDLEFKLEEKLIYGLTDTVDWAHLREQGLGNISGVALQLMFFGSILKAKWDEGDYKEAIGRCLSILKSYATDVKKTLTTSKDKDAIIEIRFTSVLPQNLKETIEVLQTATGGKGIISQETAVSNNPLVGDAKEEFSKIKSESKVDGFNLTD